MGHKRKNKPKHYQQRNSQTVKSDGHMCDVLRMHASCDFSESSSQFSSESIQELRLELQEALAKIYKEYLQDYRKRQNECLISSSTINRYQLVVETNYRNELTQKVKQLVHQESLPSIYDIFYDSVHAFVTELYNDLKKLDGKPVTLRIVCLAEAFHTVENSARELGKITIGIFEHEATSVTCENVTKLAFFDKVLKNFEGLIECVGQIEEVPEVVKEVLNLNLELRSLSERLRSVSKRPDKGLKEGRSFRDHNLSDSYTLLSHMSVDEVVSFINGEIQNNGKQRERRERRISKTSTNDNSGSPRSRIQDIQTDELDREIEEFKKKLSWVSVTPKLKPKITQEWLSSLRAQIKSKE